MTTFLIIWLWLTCYVTSLIIHSSANGWHDIGDVPIKHQVAVMLFAPVIILPTTVAVLARRIFNV